MTQDSRNLFLAMAISLVIVVGWQWYFTPPSKAPVAGQQATISQSQPAHPIAPTAPQSGASVANTSPQPMSQAVEPPPETPAPRIQIRSKALSGSLSLRGARIDDLSLQEYRETIDPKSPNIHLLSPTGSENPYWVAMGYAATPNAPKTPKEDTIWTASGTELTPQSPVTLTYDNGQGLIFSRTISVDERYIFTIDEKVENKTDKPVPLNPYAYVARADSPNARPDSEHKPLASRYGITTVFEGLIGYTPEKGLQNYKYQDIDKSENKTHNFDGTGGWLGFTDAYWSVALVPDQSRDIQARFFVTGDAQRIYQTDFIGKQALNVPAHSALTTTTRVFAGAKEVDTLQTYQDKLHIKNFDLMIDWGWFYFITKPLFWLLDYLYKLLGNFGYAIIVATLIIKALLYPFANRSYHSMAKMKALQPRMQEIKTLHADDRQQQQKAVMELYKREKVNPVSGCLPMLPQIPIFFALYKVIYITIEMRHASFIGWIKDLSAPDPTNIFTLFGLLHYDPTQLPIIGHYLVLGIWPILMGISMFLQMKMNPQPDDPVQKQMFAWMPVIFTFMLGSFPAGLVIYWTCNNMLSVIQQYIIMHRAGIKIELWDNLKIKPQKAL